MLIRIDAQRVRVLREELLITPEELAKMAGVNRSTIYNIEVGRHAKVQLGTLRKVAGALGLEPQDLREKALSDS